MPFRLIFGAVFHFLIFYSAVLQFLWMKFECNCGFIWKKRCSVFLLVLCSVLWFSTLLYAPPPLMEEKTEEDCCPVQLDKGLAFLIIPISVITNLVWTQVLHSSCHLIGKADQLSQWKRRFLGTLCRCFWPIVPLLGWPVGSQEVSQVTMVTVFHHHPKWTWGKECT